MTLSTPEAQRLGLDQLIRAIETVQQLLENLGTIPDALSVLISVPGIPPVSTTSAMNSRLDMMEQVHKLAKSVNLVQQELGSITVQLGALGDTIAPGQNFSEGLHLPKGDPS